MITIIEQNSKEFRAQKLLRLFRLRWSLHNKTFATADAVVNMINTLDVTIKRFCEDK